jgi:fatty acid CoA ligase FadD36
MLFRALLNSSRAGVVVRIGDQALSAPDLLYRAGLAARLLSSEGVVALEAVPTTEFVAALVGCLIGGGKAVPVAPTASGPERAHVIGDSGAEIFVGASDDEKYPGCRVVPWRELVVPHASGTVPRAAANESSLILYTSGTTGRPKGVKLSGQAIEQCLDALADAWAWDENDHLVHGLPLQHIHGLVLGLLGPLHVGSPVTHTVRARPTDYAGTKGSLYFGVPRVWARMCEDESSARALRGARLLVSGSAPLPDSTFDRLTWLTGCRPVQRYGMTETQITLSARADEERRPGTVGRALRGVEARVVDELGQLVDVDGAAVGELQVRGSYFFEGYLGMLAETRASYSPDGWFKTGDGALVEPDGDIRIMGRLKSDFINTNGFRVGAGEIEDVLLACRGVTEAAVIGVPDERKGERIVAFVVADEVDTARLENFIATQLSRHKWPSEIHPVKELPRNSMGKVLKRELVDRLPPTRQR